MQCLGSQRRSRFVCLSLRLTATRCNTLQHAATRCNTHTLRSHCTTTQTPKKTHGVLHTAIHCDIHSPPTRKITVCCVLHTLQYTQCVANTRVLQTQVCCIHKCLAYCTHCNIHSSRTRKMPQTEEIGLKIITTAKISNKISRESPSRTYQTHSSRKLCKSETFFCTRVE